MSRLRALFAALAVLFVVTGGLSAGVVLHRRHAVAAGAGPGGLVRCGEPVAHDRLTDSPQFVAAGTTSASKDPAFERALCTAEHSLRQVSLPPGAQPTDRAPHGLDHPAEYEMDGDLIDRARFWTGPGTWPDQLAWFGAHPPAGHPSTGSATGGSDPGGSLMFGDLIVSVRPAGSGVGIRVDAQEVWVPTRASADRIGRVDGARITVLRRSLGPGQGSPTVTRQLGVADAQRLATAIDALPLATKGTYSCPMDQGFSDTVAFHTSGGTVTADQHVGGCAGVLLTGRGHSWPALSGSVDAVLMRLLGLPANYGDHH